MLDDDYVTMSQNIWILHKLSSFYFSFTDSNKTVEGVVISYLSQIIALVTLQPTGIWKYYELSELPTVHTVWIVFYLHNIAKNDRFEM